MWNGKSTPIGRQQQGEGSADGHLVASSILAPCERAMKCPRQLSDWQRNRPADSDIRTPVETSGCCRGGQVGGPGSLRKMPPYRRLRRRELWGGRMYEATECVQLIHHRMSRSTWDFDHVSALKRPEAACGGVSSRPSPVSLLPRRSVDCHPTRVILVAFDSPCRPR